MNELPTEIESDEVIVRGICHPFHLKKDKLNWNAFRPPPSRDDVSVIRHDYMGVDFCKRKAQGLSDPDNSKTYCGLAFFRACAPRETGGDVIDSRHVYLGHADIKHVVSAPPKGDPLPGDQLERLREACKRIVELSIFVRDPDPSGEEWQCGCVDPPQCTA